MFFIIGTMYKSYKLLLYNQGTNLNSSANFFLNSFSVQKLYNEE
jgi:hypothetical protein